MGNYKGFNTFDELLKKVSEEEYFGDVKRHKENPQDHLLLYNYYYAFRDKLKEDEIDIGVLLLRNKPRVLSNFVREFFYNECFSEINFSEVFKLINNYLTYDKNQIVNVFDFKELKKDHVVLIKSGEVLYEYEKFEVKFRENDRFFLTMRYEVFYEFDIPNPNGRIEILNFEMFFENLNNLTSKQRTKVVFILNCLFYNSNIESFLLFDFTWNREFLNLYPIDNNISDFFCLPEKYRKKKCDFGSMMKSIQNIKLSFSQKLGNHFYVIRHFYDNFLKKKSTYFLDRIDYTRIKNFNDYIDVCVNFLKNMNCFLEFSLVIKRNHRLDSTRTFKLTNCINTQKYEYVNIDNEVIKTYFSQFKTYIISDNVLIHYHHFVFGDIGFDDSEVNEFIEGQLNRIKTTWYSHQQLNSKIVKQSIRASMAMIIAREQAHTESSHTMKSFQNNYLELLQNFTNFYKETYKKTETNPYIEQVFAKFKYYNQHLRDGMELTADITGGLGVQTSYEFNLKKLLEKIQEIYFPDKRIGSETFINKSLVDNQFSCHLNVIEKKVKNVMVMLPGGINSVTALLNIIKNIYRNLFKHNPNLSEKIPLKIEIDTSDHPLKHKFHKVVITELVETSEEAYDKLKEAVDSRILDKNYKVSGKAWGIKGIKINAAYLMGLAIENLQDQDYEYYDLFKNEDWYSTKHNDMNRVEHMLYLKKVKKVLVITQDEAIKNTDNWLDMGFAYQCLNSNQLDSWYQHIDNDYQMIVFSNTHKPNSFEESQCFKSHNFKVLTTSASNSIVFDNKTENFDINYYKYDKNLNYKERVLFDESHYSGIKKKIGDIAESSDFVPKEIWDKYLYHEALPKDRELNEQDKRKSIVVQIGILDERLQIYFCEEKNGNLSKVGNSDIYERDLYERKGIHIPKQEEDNLFTVFYGQSDGESNKNNNATSSFCDLCRLLESMFKDKKCSYVVLHFSGLEALANGMIISKISKFKNKLNNKNITYTDSAVGILYSYLVHIQLKLKGGQYLVLSSGKGKPTTLPNNTYYINLNTLEYFLKGKEVAKIDIINLFEQVREIKN